MTLANYSIAAAAVVIYLILGIELFRGVRSVEYLRDMEPLRMKPPPAVTIIVAARNEERNIREALQSLLAMEYQNLEVIVVNDRSTDRTGAILDAMQQSSSMLRVIHVHDLPPGWLGKNHALFLGAQLSRGELLLFTDADVFMDPSTLSRAVSRLNGARLDHLSVSPEVKMPTLFLNIFGATFAFFFSLFARPWHARNPRSSCHIGIGAFNLVRASVYREVGTHQAIAMRPDDDLKLGKLIKKNGFRQEMLFGADLIHVEWYASVREVIDGLLKNAFAGVDYSIPMTVFAIVFHLLFTLWPFAAVFTTEGLVRGLYGAAVCTILFLCADGAGSQNKPRWYALGFPLAAALFIYIIARSMIIVLANDGITWRGTHYSLKELKANKV
jgi:cellulose synthase/poly-beta-1,6-N-acetylglucosamine synthase-like glycosyltransferase